MFCFLESQIEMGFCSKTYQYGVYLSYDKWFLIECKAFDGKIEWD